MFNDTSIIKEVNILNKVLCYLLVLIMLLVLKNNIILLLTGLFFIYVNKDYKKLFIFSIITTILIILNIFFPHFLFIIKLFILIIYTIVLKRVTKLVELRYVIEVSLYRFKNKKITYKLFYGIYFLKNFNKSIKRMLLLKDDYGIKIDYKFLVFMIKESYKKALAQKDDFYEINTMRFYNYSKERSYIEKNNFEVWDMYYLISHILIFVLVFLWR